MKSFQVQFPKNWFSFGRQLAGCLILICISAQSLGQGVLRPTQTGVIQELNGGPPFTFVISGVVYTYDSDTTEFLLKGEPIADSDLKRGMVVRFSIEDGVLARVEVLGPNNMIEDFDNH